MGDLPPGMTQYRAGLWVVAEVQKILNNTKIYWRKKEYLASLLQKGSSALKGQCHEIFHLWFFSSNNFSWPQ
jgi:hypothetical protein